MTEKGVYQQHNKMPRTSWLTRKALCLLRSSWALAEEAVGCFPSVRVLGAPSRPSRPALSKKSWGQVRATTGKCDSKYRHTVYGQVPRPRSSRYCRDSRSLFLVQPTHKHKLVLGLSSLLQGAAGRPACLSKGGSAPRALCVTGSRGRRRVQQERLSQKCRKHGIQPGFWTLYKRRVDRNAEMQAVKIDDLYPEE
ncbi:hypothetical protein IF1G_10085 [Cordyceps javanica]|uniref:Uncharacterized protein n=1 Tax=Cordyceps javanica TaxID=43265 RepID=A0A545UP13_9HYPO|nr:hypothetical protein IF1G_10085 [Cordyceps javanica]